MLFVPVIFGGLAGAAAVTTTAAVVGKLLNTNPKPWDKKRKLPKW